MSHASNPHTSHGSTRRSRFADFLRLEPVGGVLLIAATVAALIWANSPAAASYHALREFTVGPHALHLDLSLGAWAADGLLAIFFFVVGLELKKEFVVGDLRDPKKAALPIAAAVGGMVAPALVFTGINLGTGGDALRGWAVPTATDIAFALAVLAVVGSRLPVALRTFLLTLAVVDDLLAITVIALFYSHDIKPLLLGAALIPLAIFAVLVRRGVLSPWLLWPLAFVTWALVHAAGIHATVAGVLLGLVVPARSGLAEEMEHTFRPLSAGLAVPVFAFFASGVTVGGLDGLVTALTDPVAVGVVAGLVVGKTVGIFGVTALLEKVTPFRLDSALYRRDILALSALAGIGFTVSLLIGELAYGGSEVTEHVKVAVLTGSVLAALLGAGLLTIRGRHHEVHGAKDEPSPAASA